MIISLLSSALALAFLLVLVPGSEGSLLMSIPAAGSPSDTVAGTGNTAGQSLPCEGIDLKPGSAVRAIVHGRPRGTTFCLLEGVHRLRHQLVAKDGQRFIGEAGAVLNGSKRLKRFARKGPFWFASNQRQVPHPQGECSPDTYRGCQYSEAVFYDDDPLFRVMRLSAVRRGRFYFDYKRDRIYIADPPKGHLVEVASARYAFAGTEDDIEIRGLVVEKFATPAQSATINGCHGARWVISGNEVRLNHAIGICGGSGSLVSDNVVHHQGQMGLAASDSVEAVFERNEVYQNNIARFDPNWEAGGSKFARTSNLVVRDNFVHDNKGPGLWTDINNVGAVIEGNRVVNNRGPGIFHEISFRALIRNNTVRDNDGDGIVVTDSSDTEIYGNTVITNAADPEADPIRLYQDQRQSDGYLTTNVFVHDNAVTTCVGSTGARDFVGDGGIFDPLRSNRFESNTYAVPDPAGQWWTWRGGNHTWQDWQQIFGQDSMGSVTTASC
ncbi:MAG: right-handed parallel beta-helix repeat-containing protein [Actinomycetota bacterium]